SQLGRGTTFVVDLPRGVPGPARAPVEIHPDAPPVCARILIVEDEVTLAQLLVETLDADGHRVDIASNGLEALERIGATRYDLIISDLKMPHMDGRQLFEEVGRLQPEL